MPATLKASDMARRVTIRVTGMQMFKFRFWLAAKIFRFGARVAGVGIEFTGRSDADVLE